MQTNISFTTTKPQKTLHKLATLCKPNPRSVVFSHFYFATQQKVSNFAADF